jgi:L-lactate dehydrogenase complex protein LldG
LEEAVTEGKRDILLGRIREALRIRTRKHVTRSSNKRFAPVDGDHSGRNCLPLVPSDYPGRLALFRERSVELKTDFYIVDNPEAATATMSLLRDCHKWTSAAAQRHPLIDKIIESIGIETVIVDERPEKKVLERCSVAITGCDALIAQTGSILVTSRSAGGRALSVLPPHHVVLATPDQLLADLPEAFELLGSKYRDRYPSFAGLITGPSRTGDIERILVLGAHGPRNLTVILVGRP